MGIQQDVERLIEAFKRVNEILQPEPTNPILKSLRELVASPDRKAARILCDELNWLVHERENLWRGLEEASERLSAYRESENELMMNLVRLIEQEAAVFYRLGIKEEDSSSVIGLTYDAIKMARDSEDPSPESLRNLRDRLRVGNELVCKAAQGPLSKAYDKLIGNKGARILAGGALAGANVAVSVIADSGAVSWVSLKAGYYVMSGKTDELIDLLEKGIDGFSS